MKSISQEAEQQLDLLLSTYSDRPRTELLLQLFLLALEREEVVSIGYRESLIAARLQRMPIEPEVRELIGRALVWAWQDEEMHALFSRGAILRLGGPRLRFQALARQAAGAVGGWATSVLQHTRWTEAPISRAVARLSTACAAVAGKLPKEVREHLEFRPFRDFCLFNAELERASKMSWQRIVDVAERGREFGPEAVNDFRRVVEDEDRHCRVFLVLADALDGQDRLLPGATPKAIAHRIAEVGEFYLPRRYRQASLANNPLGAGGPVACVQGRSIEGKVSAFREAVRLAGLAERIQSRAQLLGKPVGQMKVAVKAAFMLAYNRRDPSPTVDPVLVQELGRFLRELGCADLTILDAPYVYDRFYQNRSVEKVASYCGIESPAFHLVDAASEPIVHQYSRGMAQYTIARTWKEADFRISFGKLRSHPVDHVMLSLANLEGLGGRPDQYIFFERQASRHNSLMMLLSEFPPDFALLDAYQSVPDGLVGMMGCRCPKNFFRIYAGADALALDLMAARHIGLSDPKKSRFLESACYWFGGWSEKVEVCGTDAPVSGWRGPYNNELWALMSLCALPMYVFGSGRGLRFVPEMDLDAFPPIKPETWFLRFRRRNIRWLLGLRLRRNKL